MSLDKTRGEVIDGLGHAFRVVPNAKWRDSKLFEQAATKASEVFIRAGALWPVSFDDAEVIMQEYPAERTLAMVFAKKIRGNEHLYPWVWELPIEMIKELKALGKWDDTPIN